MVEDVEDERVEVFDVDVNKEIQVLDLEGDVLTVSDVDGKVPLKTRCWSRCQMGFHTPLDKMPMDVQAVNVDVNPYDVLLDLVVRSKVPIYDVVLLVDDVDKVDGQNDADVLGFPTVLDVQDDAEVNLRDLL